MEFYHPVPETAVMYRSHRAITPFFFTKNYGLKFGRLSNEQKSLLESFISKHTIETLGQPIAV